MQGGEQDTPVISPLLASARPLGDPPWQHDNEKPVQWVHKPHSLAEQGAAGGWLTSAASYSAGEDHRVTDGQWDSQHDPAMMFHRGRCLACSVHLGGGTALGP